MAHAAAHEREAEYIRASSLRCTMAARLPWHDAVLCSILNETRAPQPGMVDSLLENTPLCEVTRLAGAFPGTPYPGNSQMHELDSLDKKAVSDLGGLLRGRSRRAGQERWGFCAGLLGLEALGVLAEAVGFARVLVLAIGNLRFREQIMLAHNGSR